MMGKWWHASCWMEAAGFGFSGCLFVAAGAFVDLLSYWECLGFVNRTATDVLIGFRGWPENRVGVAEFVSCCC